MKRTIADWSAYWKFWIKKLFRINYFKKSLFEHEKNLNNKFMENI